MIHFFNGMDFRLLEELQEGPPAFDKFPFGPRRIEKNHGFESSLKIKRQVIVNSSHLAD